MKPPKPGSRKRVIFDRLRDGETTENIIEFGVGELKLAESTIRSWAKAWTKAGLLAGVLPATTTKPTKAKRELPSRQSNKPRVICETLGNRRGILMVEGAQQSEVMWDNDGIFRSSKTEFIPNTWLRPEPVETEG